MSKFVRIFQKIPCKNRAILAQGITRARFRTRSPRIGDRAGHMWMLCWRWRRPSSRQLRRSRRSFDRLNSRFERQAAARLRDSCGADGAAVATPAVAARPRVGPRGLQRGHPQARAAASPSLAARGSAVRRGTEPTPSAAPAAEPARSAEPQVSRAATLGESFEASQLGAPVESTATGSDETTAADE